MKSALVLLSLVALSVAYKSGAPETVCDDMTPKHGPIVAQSTQLPYTVTLSKSAAKANDVIDISISGKPFKGFFLQVRNGDKAVGSFVIPANEKFARAVNCHGGKATAVTHKSDVKKDNITLKWKAPSTPGTYQIYVTVAEAGDKFWARQPGQKITIN